MNDRNIAHLFNSVQGKGRKKGKIVVISQEIIQSLLTYLMFCSHLLYLSIYALRCNFITLRDLWATFQQFSMQVVTGNVIMTNIGQLATCLECYKRKKAKTHNQTLNCTKTPAIMYIFTLNDFEILLRRINMWPLYADFHCFPWLDDNLVPR